MHFHPTISFEQYRRICQTRAAAKPKDVPKRSWKGMVGLVVACLAIGLSPQIPAARMPVLIFFAVIAVCWIISKPLTKHSQDRCYRTIFEEERESLNDQTITIDESGISGERVNGQVTFHYSWMAFVKRIELSDAYIFLPSPNSFIRVPKEMLSVFDLEQVMSWSSLVPMQKVED